MKKKPIKKAKAARKSKASFLIKDDPNCEMLNIFVKIGGKKQELFLGNYWDLYPGCHGTYLFVAEVKADIELKDVWTDEVDPHEWCFMIGEKLVKQGKISGFSVDSEEFEYE